ncbi:unnamed protein product [Urochloa decumbens]|uniref:Uncharacterized protein n=1 Tax=Urochloa decumbens TaxID=240449 RepID=A0ABC9AU18_9POAL
MAASAPALTVAAVVLLVVLSLSSPAAVAQVPVPPTANAGQVDACNKNCASACNVVGAAACPGSCFGTPPANPPACNECLPQCTNVCYQNPDPSITS